VVGVPEILHELEPGTRNAAHGDGDKCFVAGAIYDALENAVRMVLDSHRILEGFEGDSHVLDPMR
jgi:hypothetical protein